MAADDGNKKGKAPPSKTTPVKKYRKRKPLPHLSELLAYGPEETRDQPKTWKDLVIGPLILSVIFFISFFLYMQILPHLSQPRQFNLPKRNQNEPAFTPGAAGVTPYDEPPLEPMEEKIDVNLAEF